MLIFYILLLVPAVLAYEDNATNVGVYANHNSACNLNHESNNMLCINKEFESVIQYHDVKSIAMCPYHYCVTFYNDPNKLACTGYVYLKMDTTDIGHINPLTPNISNEGFTGNPSEDYIPIGTSFEGYNIAIDRFEQSVETTFSGEIDKVLCEDQTITCVTLTDGKQECFGGVGLVFHSTLESLLLGLVVPFSMSFVVYIILGSFKCACASNACITTLLVPLFVAICCMLILFVASDFIVKIFGFLFASLVGIAFGKVGSDICYSIIYRFGKKVHTENDNGEDVRFVIEGDEDDDSIEDVQTDQIDADIKRRTRVNSDGVTEIELT